MQSFLKENLKLIDNAPNQRESILYENDEHKKFVTGIKYNHPMSTLIPTVP